MKRWMLGPITLVVVAITTTMLWAEDWTHWRGPEQNGVSRETGLVDDWSLEGKNLKWVSDIGGRSTPIVMNGHVYLNCRTHHDVNDPQEKIHAREQVVCFDAETGDIVWRDEFNVFQTDIPAPRVGWASMVGDPETNCVYVHSVSGIFRCYTADGEMVWEHSLLEEYGKISGYGGRTQTPIIDENRVIVSFLTANWGEMKGPAPVYAYYAFDKRTGELLWVSAPGEAPKDTNYSVPVVRVIDGTRMLINGGADGNVYAINARTGQPLWKFRMSHRGLNATPTVDGHLVYISHGEDNIDNNEFGRVQCIDARGRGDVTDTHSVWRVDGIKAGYTGLLVHDGILYVVADTGNLYAFDSANGDLLWEHSLGTVGKGSPVWADGKLYVMEVNGNIHILRPSRDGVETLSHVQLKATRVPGMDEIYASPAIANGNIYFVTRDRTICIGSDGWKDGTPVPLDAEKPVGEKVALLQLYPWETVLKPDQPVSYRMAMFDENGGLIGMAKPDLKPGDGVDGLVVEGDSVTFPAADRFIAGTVVASQGELQAHARVRAFSTAKVWKWDFEGYKGVQVPPTWIRAHIKLKPVQLDDGNTVMAVAGMGKSKGRPSHTVFIGTPDMRDYTIQADVLITEKRRMMASIGVTANRYDAMLKGNVGKVHVQSWPPHQRMAKSKSFRIDPDVWYTIKTTVDANPERAIVYIKAWKRGDPEPEDWTLVAEDPHPNLTGSPGLNYYATTDCMFDNVIVTFHDRK